MPRYYDVKIAYYGTVRVDADNEAEAEAIVLATDPVEIVKLHHDGDSDILSVTEVTHVPEPPKGWSRAFGPLGPG